ncbi:unnamed protein product, partial [Rotaria sp. Silwood1]
MVNDMSDLTHKFHRRIHERYNDTNEISPLRGMIYLDEKRLCHINSQLRTIINHDNDIEPHGLSFISDHPPVMYSTLIQVCLMRAALIRSKVSDFHNERCDVQIVFLNSGYSINFIQEHVEQLFPDFHISNWKSNLNQNTYDKMREEII